jgi:hypothetical protein
VVKGEPALAGFQAAQGGDVEPGGVRDLGQGQLSLRAQLAQPMAHTRLEPVGSTCHISKQA